MRHLAAATTALALVAGLAGAAGKRVVLRLESDAPQGSTTFRDSSPLAQRVTPAGNTHHSEVHRKTGRSSIYFDGGKDHLSIADGPAFGFGTDDFSVECWIRPEGAGRRFICGQAPRDGASARSSVGMVIEADARLRASARSTKHTYLLYAPQRTYADGKWHHVAFRRVGNELRFLVNGQVHDRVHIGAEPLNDSVQPFGIGRAGAFPTDPYRGYLDDFTITRQPRHVTDF